MRVLRIEGIPPHLTLYRNMHYHALNKEKIAWDEIVEQTLFHQQFQPIKGKCILTLRFFFKTKSRHDPDNFAACAKFILDSLVRHGILVDDSFDYIEELRIKQGGFSKSPYMELIFEPIETTKPSTEGCLAL